MTKYKKEFKGCYTTLDSMYVIEKREDCSSWYEPWYVSYDGFFIWFFHTLKEAKECVEFNIKDSLEVNGSI